MVFFFSHFAHRIEFDGWLFEHYTLREPLNAEALATLLDLQIKSTLAAYYMSRQDHTICTVGCLAQVHMHDVGLAEPPELSRLLHFMPTVGLLLPEPQFLSFRCFFASLPECFPSACP